MRKTPSTTPNLKTKTTPADYSPSPEQIDALAHRLMPEIKKFFANEQIQREFAEWQRQHAADG